MESERHEQRNGRIGRHGQQEDAVFIWHPVGKGFSASATDRSVKPGDVAGNHEYLMRAVIKVNTIREDLGSVGLVIARQIEEAMLGRRSSLNTASVEAVAAKTKKFVTAERRLPERIARLHVRLMEVNQMERNNAVLNAYGFGDVELEHEFHAVTYLREEKNTSSTIGETAR